MTDSGLISALVSSKSSFLKAGIAATVLLLAGCGSFGDRAEPKEHSTSNHKKLDVEKSDRVQKFIERRKNNNSLTLPPDLLETSNPRIAQAHAQGQQKQSEQVLPAVVGANIVNQDGRKWLEIQIGASEVWKRLTDYWAEEQIGFDVYNPQAGIMETEWIEDVPPSEGSRGVMKAIFNRMVGKGIAHDKFGLRLERVQDDLTHVYVSHRATTKKEKSGRSPHKLVDYEWVETEDNPEKVAELLQLIILIFDHSSFQDT